MKITLDVVLKSPLYLLFIDFEKNFRHREQVAYLECSMQEGDCGETNSHYQSGNDSTKCHMLHLGRISEKFEDKSEVYQGCFLFPTLFLPVIVDFLDIALQEYVKELNA